MTDIVERLRGNYDYTQPECYAWHKEAADEIERLKSTNDWQRREITQLHIDMGVQTNTIKRLTLENWQLKGALGYEVPADIPEGKFKCGLCEARRRHMFQPDEDGDLTGETMTDIVERLRKRVDPDDPDLWMIDEDRREAADEIERLRKQLAEYKISPQYAAELARQVDELETENEGLLGRLSDQNSAGTQETK